MSHHQKKTCAIYISNLCIRVRSLKTFVCWAGEVAQQGKPLVSMPDHLCSIPGARVRRRGTDSQKLSSDPLTGAIVCAGPQTHREKQTNVI